MEQCRTKHPKDETMLLHHHLLRHRRPFLNHWMIAVKVTLVTTMVLSQKIEASFSMIATTPDGLHQKQSRNRPWILANISDITPRHGRKSQSYKNNQNLLSPKQRARGMEGSGTAGIVSLAATPNESAEKYVSIKTSFQKLNTFFNKNFFLMGMLFAVGLAKVAPALGSVGGVPELFINKFGVALIFLLSGLSLELSQLTAAATSMKLNILVQLMTFIVWPLCIGLPFRTLLGGSILPQPLIDGIYITTCLPTTVNMCVILASSGGGNVASAIWNAVISNLAGIFVTPAWLFRSFGTSIQLPFLDMVIKLSNKVLLPVAAGQVLRQIPFIKNSYSKYSSTFKRLQEVILLSILWSAFCTAFTQNVGLTVNHALKLLVIMATLHLASLGALFAFFSTPTFGFSRADTVSAMFCASHKTLAFGLPLINTIFEGSGNLASYCAPIMFLHPLQLIIGSMLIPKLEKYTAGEAEK